MEEQTEPLVIRREREKVVGKCEECGDVHQTSNMFLVDPPTGPPFYLCVQCWHKMVAGARWYRLREEKRKERANGAAAVNLAVDET